MESNSSTIPYGPIWLIFDHPGYNCSATMAPGLAWNKVHDGTQTAFGVFSILFGVAAEMLYLPCMLALRQERNSCFRIMFALSAVDMLTLPVSAIIFGVGLVLGEVYCSHPTFHFYLGAYGLGMWCCASMIVLVLSVNRVCELLDAGWMFKKGRTNAFIAVAFVYGLLVGLLTPPPMLNSQFQSYFFNPFISFSTEYSFINWFHTINNIAVVFVSSSMYAILCIIVLFKQNSPLTMFHRLQNVFAVPLLKLLKRANFSAPSIQIGSLTMKKLGFVGAYCRLEQMRFADTVDYEKHFESEEENEEEMGEERERIE